jgi:molecular chaperone GrpE
MNEDEDQGVRITDKRRLDPQTFEVRQTPGAPEGLVEAGIAEAGLAEAERADAIQVEGELTGVEAKIAELTGDLQRVHAEYANYRKRVERDRELIKELAIGSVLIELLPTLDDVERAREHGELEGAFRTVGEGLEATLTRLGLERFGAPEEPFDPTQHEALTTESRDEVSEPTVVAVYQPGYRFAGRVLRPARVAVAGTD